MLLAIGVAHVASRLTDSVGAGESGKSTVLKQMRLLYASGFSRNEREDYRCIIFSNILNAFKILIDAMDQLEIRFEDRGNEVVSHWHSSPV